MKFRDFQLPAKIKWLEESDDYGKFVCEPFERGYGHTMGNSIRRVLLASMEGAVITSVKIEGVDHEYSTIDGIKEDVLEMIFNLKQIRFKVYTEESQRITLEISGKKEIKASDFVINESVEICNPSQHIATLDENGKIYLEAVVERGRGYSRAAARQEKVETIGEIPMDAAFSPIRKVNYDVENARVGQATDYDKLILEVWTDGSVKPRESIAFAAQIMKKSLHVFEVPEVEEIELGEEASIEKEKEETVTLPIESLEVGTRVTNSLRQAGIKTLSELLEKTESEILKIEKVGKKSIDEIKAKLEEINEEKGTSFELKR
jgi:DNA-directed RNA polymerase subunit alpha